MGPFAATVRYTAMTLAAALAGSSPSGSALAGTELRVVASIKPVHSLVSAVMAGVGEPHLLIRGRASPHTLSLLPSDAAAVAGADVAFLIDEALETAPAGALESLGTKARITTMAKAKGLVRLPFREGERSNPTPVPITARSTRRRKGTTTAPATRNGPERKTTIRTIMRRGTRKRVTTATTMTMDTARSTRMSGSTR